MQNILRGGLRIMAVCVIVVACGGYSCLGPEGDISYAPGYGYVVKVRKNPPVTDPNSNGEDYFIWFETEDEAREFIDLKRSDDPYAWTRKFQDKLNRQEGVIDDEDRDDDPYDQIRKLLRPPPPGEPPLAVPDLPQPIPPTPQ